MRRLCVMLLGAAALIAAAVCGNYLLNPFGAWRVSIVDPVYREIGDERVAIPYMLRVASPTEVLVGDSRVFNGMPIDQGIRDGVLNAALRGATMTEMIEVAQVAAQNRALKRIVFEADFPEFDAALVGVRQEETGARLDGNGPLVSETLLSMNALGLSAKISGKALAGRGWLDPDQTVPIPWPEASICGGLERSDRKALDHADAAEIQFQLSHSAAMLRYASYRLSEVEMSRFADAVGGLRRRGIDVVLFAPPISEYELEMIRQTGRWPAFVQWRRELLKAGDYWDFAGYGELARTERMFAEMMHFKPAVGEFILRWLSGDHRETCADEAIIAAAGFKVSASTIDQVLAEQYSRRNRAITVESKFSKAVARSLRIRGIATAAESP